jgi:hypothetical protein
MDQATVIATASGVLFCAAISFLDAFLQRRRAARIVDRMWMG